MVQAVRIVAFEGVKYCLRCYMIDIMLFNTIIRLWLIFKRNYCPIRVKMCGGKEGVEKVSLKENCDLA